MIYGIKDIPPFRNLVELSFQMLCSIITATCLIISILGMNAPAAFIGIGFGAILYLIITRFRSPMMVSASGAFVTPILVAMNTGGFTGVLIVGIVNFLIYGLFGLIFSKVNIDNLYKVFPKTIIGAITCVIGLNLMTFIPSYLGDTGNIGLIIALITALSTAVYSHYLNKGRISMFPFLLGLITGYVISIPFGLVDFSVFNNISLFCKPDFAFNHLTPLSIGLIISIVIVSSPYAVSGSMELLSDHGALSNIIGVDLYKSPGLDKIFFGEAVSNLITSFFGGVGACSYGEGVATVGFSKCASSFVILGASILLMLLGIFAPFQAFISSIPACVFAGSAMLLYSFIMISGFKQLQSENFDNKKTMAVVGIPISIGVASVVFTFGEINIGGIALAIIIGIILNLILRDKKQVEDVVMIADTKLLEDSCVDKESGIIIEAEDGTKIEFVEY